MDNISVAWPWLIFVRLVVIFLTALLAWVTYRSHLLLKQFRPDFNLLLSPIESAARLVLVGVCLGLAWWSGLPPAQLGLAPASPLRDILLGLMIGLIVQIVINLVTTWSIKNFGRHIYSPQVLANILPRRPVEWILVPLAFIPAVAMEELLFRSLWLGLFEAIVPVGLLIVGTSVIFGFMHLPQGKLGAIIAGGINVIFSLAFIWFGSLLVPLIAHYTVNVLQLGVAHYQREWLENY